MSAWNSLPRRRFFRRLLLVLALLWATPPGAASDPVAGWLRGELELQAAVDAGDTKELERLYSAPDSAGVVRGRALVALHPGAGAASGASRARLLEALRDPVPEVRAAAARVVGETRQRPLEREVLRLVAEDPDPRTRVLALQAVRPWTRQGHLYFLEEALNSDWPSVQAETLENLAGLEFRELPPEVTSRVEALAAPEAPPGVRRRALGALRNWHRLPLPFAQGVAADSAAPDALRLYALELSGTLHGTEGREQLLLDLLAAETSLPLAWAAFQGLTTETQVTVAFDEPLRRYLQRTAEHNTATEAMAAHLGRAGYRVDYRSGAWQISKR
ncbi:MAG: HEAT repeat domain-containing protein [Deferrisomatales bacterium]|nr:HEAT repeat domain-containing protein [Deferrisomatales bacterium]